ncbi:MAG: response regulator [Desulfobacteraceae bacterium]|jgi:two-component system chemotaxis response regulator CheY|nr:MAG: response regulator [Desulfobacteraceae bacterium]
MTTQKKMRVMIAEDEDHVRRLIRALLLKMNCEVVGEVNNGMDAVEMFKQLKPHMLLLDINMPLKSGKEALAEIRRRYQNAFIIMLTSLSDTETIEDCIKLGASGFIRKDVPLDEMQIIIRQTWKTYKESML